MNIKAPALSLYTHVSPTTTPPPTPTLSPSLSYPRTRLVGAIFNLLLQQFGAVKGNASSAFALSGAKLLENIGKGRRGGAEKGARGRKLPKKWPLAIDTTNNPNRERATAKVRQANFRLARQLFCLVVNCSQLGAACGKGGGGNGRHTNVCHFTSARIVSIVTFPHLIATAKCANFLLHCS